MAEIEITLPTVQYGNIRIKATPEEWGLETIADAPDVGVWAATYLNLFTQGFKHGATLDVDAHLGASQEAAPGDPQAAADRLADGRSPRTVDEANEMARQVIENELGPTSEVPWDKSVDSKPKPWETGSQPPEAVVTAPTVLDAVW
jgi:hypothetical protein